MPRVNTDSVLDQGRRHWADVAAEAILQRPRAHHRVATGITPSGPIHLGNMREMITGQAMYQALRGADADLVYIADTLDPLRRVYPFLPPEYQQHVGKPLACVPDPWGCCQDYADHFLRPFITSIATLGIKPRVIRAEELYRTPEMQQLVVVTLERAEQVRRIIAEVTGRPDTEQRALYSVPCADCRHLAPAELVPPASVKYECACGKQQTLPISDAGGKLVWRVDWPARWRALGVTAEPFGKDHATAGGSYDTATRLAREIFDYEPPYPVVYEWIYLKGRGAMASSTGVGVSIQAVLEVAPPELVKFLILRVRPEKHIDFDPGTNLLRLVEEYQQLQADYLAGGEAADALRRRIFELSQVSATPHLYPAVPFAHLPVVLQAAGGDAARALEILRRTGYSLEESDLPDLEQWLRLAANWLERYAPEEARFQVLETAPQVRLSPSQAALLARLADDLAHTVWTAEQVHSAVYGALQQQGLKPAEAFQACYLALLGKPQGPRLGYLLSSLPRAFVLTRFRQVAQSAPSNL